MPKALHYLINGGGGFIGSNLSDALLATRRSVVVLDDLSTGSGGNVRHLLGHERLELRRGSILDRGLPASLTARVDAVAHLAAALPA
jgi:UDP-glucose 4-epimerase